MNTPLRHAGRALIAVAVSWLAPGEATAAERKFETPIGMIVIDAEPAWKDLRPVPGGVNGIAFEVGSGERNMQLVLATLDDAGQNVDAQTVRKLAEELRQLEVADGVDLSELRSFTGSPLIGFYYQGTGAASAKPKPGEYKNMIAGLIYTNSFPLMFTIAWNDGGKSAADRAFDAVKRLKILGD